MDRLDPRKVQQFKQGMLGMKNLNDPRQQALKQAQLDAVKGATSKGSPLTDVHNIINEPGVAPEDIKLFSPKAGRKSGMRKSSRA